MVLIELCDFWQDFVDFFSHGLMDCPSTSYANAILGISSDLRSGVLGRLQEIAACKPASEKINR